MENIKNFKSFLNEMADEYMFKICYVEKPSMDFIKDSKCINVYSVKEKDEVIDKLINNGITEDNIRIYTGH